MGVVRFRWLKERETLVSEESDTLEGKPLDLDRMRRFEAHDRFKMDHRPRRWRCYGRSL